MNLNSFIWIDALNKSLLNGENRNSLSYCYQELFRKYSPVFFFEMCSNIVLSLFNLVTTHSALPLQCFNYTTINDSTRLTTAPGGVLCDNSSVFNNINAEAPTYIRFISPGGTKLATSPPNSANGDACGTYAAGWTNATYPSVVGTTVYAFVCFAYNGNPCFGYVYWIQITNCNGFYVQGLYSPGACDYRYCTQ
jgi:hypothetical protein